MPLENEMKTPKSFGGNCGVLNRSMGVIIILYVGMGFFGYLKYGTEIKGSITLNLPTNEWYAFTHLTNKLRSKIELFLSLSIGLPNR